MCNKPELHLCNQCRLNQGFKRNKMKRVNPPLSYCKGCKKVAGILPSKHYKQISAPLKDELREELATLRNVIKDLTCENEKLKSQMFINVKDELPQNEKPVLVTCTARFKRYKHNSQQARRGIAGRWQEFSGYGWSNTMLEVVSFKNITNEDRTTTS